MRTFAILVLLSLAATACGGTPNATPSATGLAPSKPSAPSRTLVIAFRVEPASIALHALRESGVTDYLTKRLFNASLGQLDNQGQAQPYLASTLPQVDTNSWEVFPDGSMQTTYLLNSQATWQDGAPLTADDFVFAWQVSRMPDLGQLAAMPMSLMDDVNAPDPRTVVIHWRRLYTEAGHLSAHNFEFTALPEHLLGESFRSGSADAFANLPFWTRDYIGAGPFKIDRWEAGAFAEASAFDGDLLGRPKIDRVRLVFIGDGNTVLSNMLAGEVQLSGDGALRVEQAITLRSEWAPKQAGGVVMQPNQWRAVNFQMREELSTPRALLDVRVRRALAHSTDKQAIDDALYSGVERLADFVIPPLSQIGVSAERAAAKYPYDLQRAEALMNEAGFTKDADGFYSGPGGRFSVELKTNAAPDNEQELAVITSGYRSAGFDAQQAVLPVAQAQDPQIRATFPSMYVNSTPALETTLVSLTAANIPTADNRWRGSNRGGWSDPEYSRLAEQFGSTLDEKQRAEQVDGMARIFSDQLPAISLIFRSQPWAYAADLQGLTEVPPETNIGWNVEQWSWRQ